MIGLKPCPFCGAKMPIVRYIATDGHAHVFCYKLAGGCGALTLSHVTLEEAVEAWNTRAPGWIPCSERLPESAGVAVIVSAKNRYDQNAVFIAFQGYGDFKWHTMTAGYMNHEHGTEISDAWTITHWMPLPDPPEKCADS